MKAKLLKLVEEQHDTLVNLQNELAKRTDEGMELMAVGRVRQYYGRLFLQNIEIRKLVRELK